MVSCAGSPMNVRLQWLAALTMCGLWIYWDEQKNPRLFTEAPSLTEHAKVPGLKWSSDEIGYERFRANGNARERPKRDGPWRRISADATLRGAEHS